MTGRRMAERIGLPILLQSGACRGEAPQRAAAPAPTAIPDVYRETLEELGFLEGGAGLL